MRSAHRSRARCRCSRRLGRGAGDRRGFGRPLSRGRRAHAGLIEKDEAVSPLARLVLAPPGRRLVRGARPGRGHVAAPATSGCAGSRASPPMPRCAARWRRRSARSAHG
jgi:hypothetical protein